MFFNCNFYTKIWIITEGIGVGQYLWIYSRKYATAYTATSTIRLWYNGKENPLRTIFYFYGVNAIILFSHLQLPKGEDSLPPQDNNSE